MTKEYDCSEEVHEVFRQLGDIYVKLLLDLESKLEEVDGILVDFSPADGNIDVSVAAEHSEMISDYITKLINEYNDERARLLRADPLLGIKALVVGDCSN